MIFGRIYDNLRNSYRTENSAYKKFTFKGAKIRKPKKKGTPMQ